MYRFRLPDIGEGLSDAELLEWSVSVGDEVAEGQQLAMISTDKVNVDLPSPVAGVIRQLCCEVGDVVPVGEIIVVIDDGRSETEQGSAGAAESPPPPGEDSRPDGRVEQDRGRPAGEQVKAAPITRRLAAELGVDIQQVTGTGPDGQVLTGDVKAHAAGQQGQSVAGPAGRLKLSGGRLSAARRLAESSRQMATTCMSFEVHADAILRWCDSRRESADDRGVKLTPLAAVARCLCRALTDHPHFNGTIAEADNELLMFDEVNLGLAVATDEGLLVPVLRSAQALDPLDLAAAIERLAVRARAAELTLEDMRGGTFTLSSTGGLEKATLLSTAPIINMPNVATMWVSRISYRPRVINDMLEAGPVMYGTLAFDHRYLHGADGVAFLNHLTGLFENPD